MNNLFMYLKVKIKKDAILAVDLAEKSPSIRNFNLANKILTMKLTSEELKLQKNPNDISLIQEKIKNYESLFFKLNEIKMKYACEDKYIVEIKTNNRQQKKIIEDYKNRGGTYDFTKEDVNINRLTNENLIDFISKDKKINNGKFNNFDIKDGNINSADIYNSRFEKCNINGSIFTDCKLINFYSYASTIKNSTFNHCDLTNADFTFSNVENVNFINSDLSGAKIKVKSANFKNATLDNTKIELDFNNLFLVENAKSLFETIESIDEKYHETKTLLMSGFISKISNALFLSYKNMKIPMGLIVNNIFSNEYFCQDETIKKFITEVLYTSYFNNEYNNYIDKLSPDFLSFHLDLIDNYDNNKLTNFMLEKNDQFIKLMILSLYHENKDIRDRARALYDKYLDLEEIKPFVQKEIFGYGDKVVDWSDKSSCNYILINKNKNKKIIVDHENIVNMLFNYNIENNASWNKFYLYINGDCQISNSINYYELFNGFKLLEISTIPDFVIFKNSYNKMTNKIESNKWLSLFKSSDFYDQFHSALIGMKPSSNKEFIDIKKQEYLAETFRPFLNISDDNIKKASLNIGHYQKLCEIFDIALENNELKSQYLLSLSALMIKYSSKSVFGTGSDSLEILRMYAYALMNKANELNPELMGGNYDKWSDRLLGMNNEFECTDILFSIMNDYGKKHFQNIFYKIIPLHWR
ncbi:pentapeptide repeat-containing protein [Proteus columbae]|uniref:pentapeptide repeat-containing protein n=1 Tax=Proteus columbae TaxID=1987580 RepID=UPI0028897808|nr:pentapeptide repeat-containing protein [Proteus columbae]